MKKLFINKEDLATKDLSLEMAIRYNIGQANTIRKEIKKLQELKYSETKANTEIKKAVAEKNDSQEEEEEDEYLYYYSNLQLELKTATTEEEKRNIIKNNLPVLENKNYMIIVNRIRAEVYKETLELKKLKSEVVKDKDFEVELEKEIQELEKVSRMIIQSQFEQIDQLSLPLTEQNQNKLIFLNTPGGAIYAENDLIAISREYYEGFKNLLLSIENGTFKNVKKFPGNGTALSGIAEVKDYKIRVLFDRVARDKYIIIDIFVKKSDNDKAYQESLRARVDYYKKNKNVILSSLDDESYLNEQAKIRNNIIQGLEKKNLVKGMRI